MSEKTTVMRMLDQAGIAYTVHHYETTSALSGVEVAQILGMDPQRVFKTLVTVAKSGRHYIFMLPALEELDLKKAALAVGEKSLEMLPAKELLPLTGYVHGGCSPMGMKKNFPTFIDEIVILFDTFLCSAGKIGWQIELSLTSLQQMLPLKLADLSCP